MPWDENQASLVLRWTNVERIIRDVLLRRYGIAPIDQICRVYKVSTILEATSTF